MFGNAIEEGPQQAAETHHRLLPLASGYSEKFLSITSQLPRAVAVSSIFGRALNLGIREAAGEFINY
jgi:hypothetical protein